MIVHSLNKRRQVVEKDLFIDNNCVYLKHNKEFILVEKDVDVWEVLSNRDIRNNIVNMINLTSKCNLNCSYCYFKKIHSGWKNLEIDIEQAKEALLKVDDVPSIVKYMKIRDVALSDDNFPKIRLSGGEPTIWKPLSELLHFAVDNKNNNITVLSNGLELSSKEFMKGIPSVSQITWAITLRDTLESTSRTIENILRNNNQLVFNIVFADAEQAKKLTDFCVKWNPQAIRYRVLVDYFSGNVYGCQSDMIGFICGYFGMDKSFYLNNCRSTSPYISCLPYSSIGQEFSIYTILTPTWSTIVLEEAVKSRTFLFSYKTGRYDSLLIEVMYESSEFRKWRVRREEEKL